LKKSPDTTYEKWKLEFERLENELIEFRDYFNSFKKCSCDIRECYHYKKARHIVFGNRIDQLHNLRLQIGIQTYEEITNTKQRI
jgi:hypothetical protein